MLRTVLIFCAMFVAVGMANAGPLKLTNTQMDMVTAGDLGLPSGTIVHENFDNPAPRRNVHPYFVDDNFTPRKGATITGNEGPWSAAFNSPVIICVGC